MGTILLIGLGLAGLLGLAVVGAGAWFVLRPQPEVVNNPAPGDEPQTKTGALPPLLAPKHRIKTGLKQVGAIFLSADGRRVAVNEYDSTKSHQLEVWDIGPPHKLVRTFNRVAYALSPDGRVFAVEVDFPGSEVIDVASGNVVSGFRDSRGNTAAFADKDTLVIASNDATDTGGGKLKVVRYDVNTGRKLGTTDLLDQGTRAAEEAVVAGASKELVVAEEKPGLVTVLSMATGKRVRGAALAGFPATARVYKLATSPDGTRMAVTWPVMRGKTHSSDSAVYDTATGAELWSSFDRSIDKMLMPNRDVVLARTNWMRGGNHFFGWRAYDLRTKAVVADIVASSDMNAAASADGRVLAIGSFPEARSELLVWDLSALPQP